jgi:hypothetical protein
MAEEPSEYRRRILREFVLSGRLAEAKDAEAAIFMVLLTFCDPAGVAVLSYRNLMRFTGIMSERRIHNAILGLQSLGVLSITPHQRNSTFRGCNEYHIKSVLRRIESVLTPWHGSGIPE